MSERSGSGTRPAQSNVVWRRISERIEQRLAVIEQGIAALLSGSLSTADSATCRAEASLLVDWLFALDQIVAGRVARDIVDHFDGLPVLNDAAAIATAVDRLRTIVRVAEDEWGNVAAGESRVHFVSGANAQIDAVAWHLQQHGINISYSPTFFSTPADIDLLVVMSEHPSDALQLLTTVRQRSPKVVRALVHASNANPQELLRVAPSTDLLLRYDAKPAELANQIMIALRPQRRVWSQAVLYGANGLYPELVQAGFTGLIAESAGGVINMIEAGSQVVVLGPAAPRRAELVHLIRSSPNTQSAVITASFADEAERERCSRAGANFTLPETYASGTWGEQLRALTIAYDQSSGVIADDSAPLPSGHRAWVTLERAIEGVHRSRRGAALATISLPQSATEEQVAHMHAHLAHEFRSDDTIAAVGQHSVAVMLAGATPSDAVDRLQRAISGLNLVAQSGMVGIAAFPQDGLGVKALVDVATTAAGRSATNQGPVVVSSDWFPGMLSRLDVFVVESEPTLGRLLNRLITKEGYNAHVVGTGSEALSTLTGPSAIAPPRLILLELDAMGADGMMILRSLARAGILNQSEVIVTCSLINDGQLREAFELGATDVITKPFSSVVLGNRIHRALKP